MRAAMKYDDEKCYQFHEKDLPDRCFTCGQGAARLLIVRQIAGMMLVHLCPNCMVDHMDDYLLDNTRPEGRMANGSLCRKIERTGVSEGD
jgi:hypothetical protein